MQKRLIDKRKITLIHWLRSTLGEAQPNLCVLKGDASFRRYFRLFHDNQSYIVMDSPPEKENSSRFIQIARFLKQKGLRAPRIYQHSDALGFVILEDFGDQLLLDTMLDGAKDKPYQIAIDTLLKLQQIRTVDELHLPSFDAPFMQSELNRVEEWLLHRLLQLRLTKAQTSILHDCFDQLIAVALQQTQCLTHRDYHSRNLMLLSPNQLGILDFQDAIIGPITYDLVSLLKDCYILWPQAVINKWRDYYYTQALEMQCIPQSTTPTAFAYDFDLMGMQRHFKALGIFARLAVRDKKQAYLKDIPRVIKHLQRMADKYQEFNDLRDILEIILKKIL